MGQPGARRRRFTTATRSAELSPNFRVALMTETPVEILQYLKKYDVDVIEVVGHTDERPIGARQFSNLDRDLTSVLQNTEDVASLLPPDGIIWRLSLPPTEAARTVEIIGRGAPAEAVYDWGGGLVWLRLPMAEDGGWLPDGSRLSWLNAPVVGETRKMARPLYPPFPFSAKYSVLPSGARTPA